MSDLVKSLTAERDALAAQVEALRVAWEAVKATDWNKPLEEAFAATPQQHLAEIRAEAGRAGFVAGARCVSDACINEEDTWYDSQIASEADQYAERVKDGE